MHELSTVRLYLLRGMYLLLIVGLATTIWPLMIASARDAELMRGVVWTMLTALSLLAILGLRYPVKMMPLLFFELSWKLIWVSAVGVPLWWAGEIDAATRETLMECLFGVVIVPFVIPWRYVFVNFAQASGDPWRKGATSMAASIGERSGALKPSIGE
jgi:hypothetical protein